ncbi:hypothetical protein ABE151_17340 [Bacillus paralicheniformis]|uniref:hypothetical protein n=1 Tax=Bacillus paralicheniformis TaxID=1648923 RepID=UPI003D1DDA05
MTVKAFYHLRDSWYGHENLKNASYVDEIMIGLYEEDEGTDGEFVIRWLELEDGITPRLEAFDDSWIALNECLDFIQALKDSKGITPDECVELLLKLGYEDFTKRENPNK